MPTDLRHHLGRIGEDLALAHLERLGYTLVARNHRTRHGELDLVVFDGTDYVGIFPDGTKKKVSWDAYP